MKEKISVIIPVLDFKECRVPVEVIKNNKYIEEIIIVKGKQPSIQRNEATKIARGEILYFLDNDSIPDLNNFERMIKFFELHKDASVIGGPSLMSEDDKGFSFAVGTALSSFLGSAFSSARYNSKGNERLSDEKELILCNMAFKKKIFKEFGMFNTNLYPNEENELLNRIKKNDGEIWYLPNLVVYRGHRRNIFALIKQIFRYGRGRAEEFFIDKKFPLFAVISLFFDLFLCFSIINFSFLSKIILIFYLTILILFSFYKTLSKKKIFLLIYLPIIFFIIHSIYGIGFLWGVIKKIIKSKKKFTSGQIIKKTKKGKIIFLEVELISKRSLAHKS